MQKLLPIVLWIPTAFLALSISVVLLVLVSGEAQKQKIVSEAPIIPISEVLGAYHSNIISEDARPEIIAKFLENHQCPLEPYDHYAAIFVETADKYGLDFRLLPAISMQESNCCKKTPTGTYNCWGFGIYGDQVLGFDSYEHGIDTVGNTLAKHYTSQGLMAPDEIMRKYTPSSKGTWAYGVLYFMNEMQ